MQTVHVTITGRVQGVGYRAWTVDKATRLGLTGWVRNRINGTVEAVFQGEDARVDDMVAQCWQGPLLARILGVQQRDLSEDEIFATFTAKSTL
jgi:acylphosphatase